MPLVSEVLTVKGSELPEAAALVRDEKFVVISQGITKQFPVTLLNELLQQGSYISGTFNPSDVVDGILTLNHGLNTDKVVVFITNPQGENQWVPWKKVDANTITVNFGGAPDDGDSQFIILYWNAGADFNEETKFKTIPIDGWDLATTLSRSIAHGLVASEIVSITGVIFSDVGAPIKRTAIPGDFDAYFNAYIFITYDDINITLTRNSSGGGWESIANGYYANQYYRSLGARGFLHVTYKTS